MTDTEDPKQFKIDQFGTFTAPSSRGPPGQFTFGIVDKKWTCTCEFMRNQKRGLLCRHILQHLLDSMKETNEYVGLKREFNSTAEFDCFEQAMAALQCYKSLEMEVVCNTILSLALTRGSVYSDQVVEILGDPPTSTPQTLSACWGSLQKRGWIKRVGTRRSDRERTHGSDQGIYVLTEEGHRVLGIILKFQEKQ